LPANAALIAAAACRHPAVALSEKKRPTLPN